MALVSTENGCSRLILTRPRFLYQKRPVFETLVGVTVLLPVATGCARRAAVERLEGGIPAERGRQGGAVARSEDVGADHPEDELVGGAAAVAGAVDQWAVRGIADQALITADQIDADALRRIVAADGGEAELLHAATGVIGLQTTLPRLRAGHPEVVILVILRADNNIALEQKAPALREAVHILHERLEGVTVVGAGDVEQHARLRREAGRLGEAEIVGGLSPQHEGVGLTFHVIDGVVRRVAAITLDELAGRSQLPSLCW